MSPEPSSDKLVSCMLTARFTTILRTASASLPDSVGGGIRLKHSAVGMHFCARRLWLYRARSLIIYAYIRAWGATCGDGRRNWPSIHSCHSFLLSAGVQGSPVQTRSGPSRQALYKWVLLSAGCRFAHLKQTLG